MKLTSEHGNKEKGRIAHDGQSRYGIEANGKFAYTHDMPVHLFRGLDFEFQASGRLLERAILDFELKSNSCHDHAGVSSTLRHPSSMWSSF